MRRGSGSTRREHERILGPARKAAERDLAVAVAQQWEFGATTVSASVALAASVGIEVFATGGIGGVHRGVELTGDISADLDALAHHPVITVCAGAKAFLDLARTLEYLETVGVPVLAWRHDWFPAFYTRSSGLRAPHRVDSATEVVATLRHRTRSSTGVLVGVPIPEHDELDPVELDVVLTRALDDCQAAGIVGAAVTPFVLGRIAEATDGPERPRQSRTRRAQRGCGGRDRGRPRQRLITAAPTTPPAAVRHDRGTCCDPRRSTCRRRTSPPTSCGIDGCTANAGHE